MCSIQLKGITKTFKGGLTAVNNVDLTIKKGEVFGLLGPNGAGKSTIIKILCTILTPTFGSAQIFKSDILSDRRGVRKKIGVVFQDSSLDDELTAYENLIFHGKVYGLDNATIKRRITKLLNLVGLTDKSRIFVQEFSGGMRRRLEIARSLLHKPQVIFLDEPTLGLDPQTRTKIWDHITELNKNERVTVILTTHYMEEADRLCSRIGIIEGGEILTLGKTSKLKSDLGGDTVIIESQNPNALMRMIGEDKRIIKAIRHSNKIMLTVTNGEKSIPTILRTADKKRISIESVSLNKPTLEDVFLHFTGRRIRDENAENKARKMRMIHMQRR